MTNQEEIQNAIEWIAGFREGWDDKDNIKYCNMAIKALEKQKAIAELQPPTDDWETYADRLYDLAYLTGYNDGLIAKRGE